MRTVFVNGCFDSLHLCHARFLRAAKTYGDWLIVGINSDESVRRLKGEERPIFGQTDRHEMLMELRSVDRVIIFHEDTPTELVRVLRPDVLVKGWEYRPGGLPCPERDVVANYGGEVVHLRKMGGVSTTGILRLEQHGK